MRPVSLLESKCRGQADYAEVGYALQPIVPTSEALSSASQRFGRCEVLARPRLRSGQAVSDWFAAAKSDGRLPEVDLALVGGLLSRISATSDTPRLSINVSPESIESRSAFDRIVDVLVEVKAQTKSVCIEITEHSSFKSPELVHARLKLLRAMGFAVALDDFGVGSNHILLVASGAVSEIKLDRAWLAPIVLPEQLTAMVKFAHSLSLHVVAEGVESLSDLRRAAEAGCDFVQGYLLGAPVPLRATEAVTH